MRGIYCKGFIIFNNDNRRYVMVISPSGFPLLIIEKVNNEESGDPLLYTIAFRYLFG